MDKLELPFHPYPKIALSPSYPAAASPYRAVPTPVVSVATIPALLTRLVMETFPETATPYPKVARRLLLDPTFAICDGNCHSAAVLL